MSSSDERIIESYKYLGSIKAVAKDTKYSWHKIVKSLSSNGYVLSETHAEILNGYENGESVDDIAKKLDLNTNTVKAYLPRVRPVYNENPSQNALGIKKCRERKRL